MNRRQVAQAIIGLLGIAVIVAAAFQVYLLQSFPIARGSSTWSSVTGECERFEPRGETTDCVNVPFDAGAPIGIGFSLRNTGRVPLTVVSIESLGAFSPISLAELHAALPQEGELFSPDRPRPFEPVTIAPGEEATIQFTGNVRDCAAVRGHWVAGSAGRFEVVRLKVRWLLVTTDVEIPLRQSLQVEAPAIDQCIPPPIDSMRG